MSETTTEYIVAWDDSAGTIHYPPGDEMPPGFKGNFVEPGIDIHPDPALKKIVDKWISKANPEVLEHLNRLRRAWARNVFYGHTLAVDDSLQANLHWVWHGRHPRGIG